MNKFKVGDRVRVIDTTLMYYNKIGTILEKRSNNVYDVIFEFNKEEKFRYVGDELELVEKENNMKEFTLSDLTDDMIVETKSKIKYLVISDAKVLIRCDEWLSIDNYLKDLTSYGYEEFNIDKVWKIKSKNGYTNLINLLTDDYISRMVYCNKIELVYDRNKPQPKKMTIQQICEELGYEVEIVKE